jgi:hypothetical protein
MPERSGVTTGMVGDFDQQPTDIAVALLGDTLMIGVVSALVYGRDESEVGRQFVGRLEARDISDRGYYGLSGGDADTG